MRHFFNEEEKLKNLGNDHCSETETEEFGRSYNASSETNSSDACKADHDTSKPTTSYIISPNRKMAASHDHLNKSPVCQTSSRKRIRIFLSDDESDDPCDQDQTRRRLSEGVLHCIILFSCIIIVCSFNVLSFSFLVIILYTELLMIIKYSFFCR